MQRNVEAVKKKQRQNTENPKKWKPLHMKNKQKKRRNTAVVAAEEVVNVVQKIFEHSLMFDDLAECQTKKLVTNEVGSGGGSGVRSVDNESCDVVGAKNAGSGRELVVVTEKWKGQIKNEHETMMRGEGELSESNGGVEGGMRSGSFSKMEKGEDSVSASHEISRCPKRYIGALSLALLVMSSCIYCAAFLAVPVLLVELQQVQGSQSRALTLALCCVSCTSTGLFFSFVIDHNNREVFFKAKNICLFVGWCAISLVLVWCSYTFFVFKHHEWVQEQTRVFIITASYAFTFFGVVFLGTFIMYDTARVIYLHSKLGRAVPTGQARMKRAICKATLQTLIASVSFVQLAGCIFLRKIALTDQSMMVLWSGVALMIDLIVSRSAKLAVIYLKMKPEVVDIWLSGINGPMLIGQQMLVSGFDEMWKILVVASICAVGEFVISARIFRHRVRLWEQAEEAFKNADVAESNNMRERLQSTRQQMDISAMSLLNAIQTELFVSVSMLVLNAICHGSEIFGISGAIEWSNLWQAVLFQLGPMVIGDALLIAWIRKSEIDTLQLILPRFDFFNVISVVSASVIGSSFVLLCSLTG